MKNVKYLSVAVCVLFFSCEITEQIRDKLMVFGVDFRFDNVAVSPVIPAGLQTILDVMPKKAGSSEADQNIYDQYLSTTGLNVICTLTANNPNENRAVFDGADFHLRINDTTKQDSAVTTRVDTFSVKGNDSTKMAIAFPLMLDNPAFSKSTFQKIIEGRDIPYKLSADLFFNLIVPSMTGESDTLKGEPVALDLVNSALPTRPTDNMVSLFLRALDLLL
ncbi:MAG: hypothetical protein GF401_05520 [Chitinivibrionales bacterium]|nr:hypothetical protein [Chitinivibrionales bacterium]